MKAEYLMGLEIIAFLVGYFIRDLKSLGADSPNKSASAGAHRKRSAAPKNNPRQPW